MKRNIINAIDLFCGAGGLTSGLQKAGIKVMAGYDIEEQCRFAYEFNNHTRFINKDVSLIDKNELAQHYSSGSIRLLAGCAPCQPFSKYNQGKDITLDQKWLLLYEFSRLIEINLPELVTMENVPEVVKYDVYNDFLEKLKKLGYYIWADTVICANYGIPQNRRRHVLLASLLGKIELIEPTHKDYWISVRDAISHLPRIKSGEQDKQDSLHRSVALNEINLKRIRASKQGGSWKDWPEDLRLECHKKSSGSTYVSIYGRMKWDEPSPTITTQCYGYGNGRFGHPEQDRAISLREAALLQSFPSNYQFYPSNIKAKTKDIGKMIGNAVPVRLGEIIGLSFKKHIESLF